MTGFISQPFQTLPNLYKMRLEQQVINGLETMFLDLEGNPKLINDPEFMDSYFEKLAILYVLGSCPKYYVYLNLLAETAHDKPWHNGIEPKFNVIENV